MRDAVVFQAGNLSIIIDLFAFCSDLPWFGNI